MFISLSLSVSTFCAFLAKKHKNVSVIGGKFIRFSSFYECFSDFFLFFTRAIVCVVRYVLLPKILAIILYLNFLKLPQGLARYKVLDGKALNKKEGKCEQDRQERAHK